MSMFSVSSILKLGNNLTFKNFISYGLPILSLIVSVLAYCDSRKAVIASGVFDKPELTLTLRGHHLDDFLRSEIYFGLNESMLPFSEIRIPIGLHNHGKKTVENAMLSFYYNQTFGLLIHNDSTVNYEHGYLYMERTFFKESNSDNVVYKLSALNPNSIEDPGDIIKVNNISQLLDGYTTRVKINYSATGVEEKIRLFDIHFVKTKSLQALIDTISIKKLADKNDTISNFYVIYPTGLYNSSKSEKLINVCLSTTIDDVVNCNIQRNQRLTSIKSKAGELRQKHYP